MLVAHMEILAQGSFMEGEQTDTINVGDPLATATGQEKMMSLWWPILMGTKRTSFVRRVELTEGTSRALQFEYTTLDAGTFVTALKLHTDQGQTTISETSSA